MSCSIRGLTSSWALLERQRWASNVTSSFLLFPLTFVRRVEMESKVSAGLWHGLTGSLLSGWAIRRKTMTSEKLWKIIKRKLRKTDRNKAAESFVMSRIVDEKVTADKKSYEFSDYEKGFDKKEILLLGNCRMSSTVYYEKLSFSLPSCHLSGNVVDMWCIMSTFMVVFCQIFSSVYKRK